MKDWLTWNERDVSWQEVRGGGGGLALKENGGGGVGFEGK